MGVLQDFFLDQFDERTRGLEIVVDNARVSHAARPVLYSSTEEKPTRERRDRWRRMKSKGQPGGTSLNVPRRRLWSPLSSSSCPEKSKLAGAMSSPKLSPKTLSLLSPPYSEWNESMSTRFRSTGTIEVVNAMSPLERRHDSDTALTLPKRQHSPGDPPKNNSKWDHTIDSKSAGGSRLLSLELALGELSPSPRTYNPSA